MSIAIRIFATPEMELVRNGTIDGDTYADGEVYADAIQLMYFREHGTPMEHGEEFREV